MLSHLREAFAIADVVVALGVHTVEDMPAVLEVERGALPRAHHRVPFVDQVVDVHEPRRLPAGELVAGNDAVRAVVQADNVIKAEEVRV